MGNSISEHVTADGSISNSFSDAVVEKQDVGHRARGLPIDAVPARTDE